MISQQLARAHRAGATAVFLCPSVFAKDNQPTALLPLENKGTLATCATGSTRTTTGPSATRSSRDLPTGLLDYQFYREILGEKFFGGPGSARRVCGRHDQHIVRLQFRPDGLRISGVGQGRVILNSLLIRENLSAESSHPVAERLLRNMLNFSRGD